MATYSSQPDETNATDTWLGSDAATTNHGTDADFQSIMTAGGSARRAIIKFDISSIPASSVISSATLTLNTAIGLTTDQLSLHRITQAWTEGGSTWNTYNGTNNWSTAGGDYDAVADATATPSATTAGTDVTFTVTTLIQELVDGTTNNGFLIKLTSETGNTKGVSFDSSTVATSTDRPKLEITYEPPVPGIINFI